MARHLLGNDWVNTERAWILVHNNNSKIAVCSVYMACESSMDMSLKTWKDTIYATLQGELRYLEDEGYECLIIGDFNAHVGGPPFRY